MHASHEGKPVAMRIDARGSDAAAARDTGDMGANVPGNGRSALWSSVARLGGILSPARAADQDPAALLRGRGNPSGGRRSNGSLVRTIGGPDPVVGPRFDAPVPPGGYTWWYVDAISEDGSHGLTIIAFMGSVFSPYYKASGRYDPINHSSLNVALYGPKARWVMTERPRSAVERDSANFQIGPSGLRWTGDALEIDIAERDSRILNPFRRPVRGKVRVIPEALNPIGFALTAEDRHVWHCLAPRARIEVQMDEPGLSWSGSGYLDHNRGEDPLEDGFNVWHWSRAHLREGALVCYEGERKDGSRFASAIHFDAQGIPHKDELPPIAKLPNTKWRIKRQTRSDNRVSQVIRNWEDTPFYSRSELQSRIYGEDVVAVQESLDMRRFDSRLVQMMLPFRMPREET